ncbi:MAG: mannose-1-phosphate guanylyltransferase/mannose-6-phosphate isomerase [Porticoccaceae bacterium]
MRLLPSSIIVPVLMAGGSGTRLWPLSREQYPKQFLPLLGDKSLLQDTALRASSIENVAAPIVIGAEAHRFIIAEQMQAVGIRATILLESEGRNTAPAAAVAAHFVAQQYGPDAMVFLMASDQAMTRIDRFRSSTGIAAKVAANGHLVTFGIQPMHPETGFGWIKGGNTLAEFDDAYEVGAFIEKPPLDMAEHFLKEGGYYWNGGMFLFRSDAFLDALRQFEPDMYSLTHEAVEQAQHNPDFIRLHPEAFQRCRNISIDYAVMEKSKNIALVPLDAGWDDVGSWNFMAKRPASDAAGNRLHGDVLAEDARNNLVHASHRLVTLLGVEDTIVVETVDAVLVTTKDRAQDIKQIVQKLKRDKRPEAASRPRVYRPWGFYETVALSERFQVKRIMVKPGQKLSLQMHHHRAEHWVVVRGTAAVTCGDKVFLMTEDQSTYVPLGQVHRLENPGKVPLELIEVQTGAYLGEDDIVRYEDIYGRLPATPAREVTTAGVPA